MTRIGGTGIPLPLLGLPALAANTGNRVTLKAGQTMILPPGRWLIGLGLVTAIQVLEPFSVVGTLSTGLPAGMWRTIVQPNTGLVVVDSDGQNVRLANLSGCIVGALVTAAGSAYTNGIGTVAVTPSQGGAILRSIVGGVVASTTQVAGGANYVYPPLVFFPPPPPGGIQATAVANLTAGVVSSLTMINQGAGYLTAPTPFFVNDSRDTTGAGASFTSTLGGSGTVTGVVVLDPGNPVTSVTTLSFGSGAATATALMNFSVTGYTVGTAGSGYSAIVKALTNQAQVTTAGAYTNPSTEKGITTPRMAQIENPVSGGVLTAASGAIGILLDPGTGFQLVPSLWIVNDGGAAPTTNGALTATVGGVNDDVLVQYLT